MGTLGRKGQMKHAVGIGSHQLKHQYPTMRHMPMLSPTKGMSASKTNTETAFLHIDTKRSIGLKSN
jgi:hypothetical protein